jgi:hypothetical protein
VSGSGTRDSVATSGLVYLHSQVAFSGATIFSMSIVLLPWEVWRMTLGSTPISSPILGRIVSLGSGLGKS